MIDFDKIVKKLWSKKGSILLAEDIAELIDPTAALPGSQALIYKTIYRLVHSGIIFRIRNGVFLIGHDPLVERLPQFIDSRYWELVTAFIRSEAKIANAIIAGPKSIELTLQDFSAPKMLHVYVKDFATAKKVIHIGDRYSVEFRSVKQFQLLYRQSIRIQTPGVRPFPIRILKPEAALLDALTVHAGADFDQRAIQRFLDRYAEELDREILGNLVSQKYITAINRLRELAKKWGHDSLYAQCISVIRDEGAGCFLSV